MKALSQSPRLYISADIAAGAPLTITGDQAHYLQHVMRLKEGANVRLFNGRDGEWHGRIRSFTKRGAEIALEALIREQKSEPDLWLCCAPIKKAHFEYMIEKACELGAAVIQPVLTAHTQIREINIERCLSIAAEAAEQSERMSIPKIHKPVSLEKLIAGWPQGHAPIICAEKGEALAVRDAFEAPLLKSAKQAAVVTGPEGGFSAEELEMLGKIPHAVFIRLGPRILRADTAAIAAMTCWQALCGDWQQA